LPLWLTASPQSDTLDPQATQTITFTVNEGLNTGNYQEDLFLSSDFGFDEKLTLSLRVFEPLPDAWEVDPTQFQFSMNIIAQVKIDGRISNDPNDVVVVFVNGEARGRINLEYVPAYDNYQAFLTIYSNSQSGEVLDIKVWDDSKGQVFTDITPTYTFSSNANFGQPANPQVLETGSEIEEKLEIPSGWKWVSFNLSTPDLSDVNLILSELSPQDGDLIKGRLHFDQYSAADGTWLGTITNNGGLQNEQMYRLHMGNAGTIVYEGTPAVPAMTPITIKRGWNWIGFVSNQNLAVNEALSGFNATDGDIIKSQYLLAVYDANFGWIGNLDFLIPGEGYMLNAQNAGTLVYPESSAINGRTMTSSNDLTHFELGNIKLDPHAYRYQMTAITQLVNYPHTNVKPNTRLLALADGNVQGIARPKHNPITNQYDYFLVLYTNEPNTRFEFKLTDDTGEVLSDIQETLDFKINDVQGELDAPLKLHLNQTIIHENAFEVFPNPVHDQATLRLQLMEKAEVKVEIIDAVGKQVAIIPANALSAGIHEFEWDTQQVTSGVYYVRATLNGETFMHRLMILK
ncbi:MAG: T9SS type A sorting domain-containing protein, partial [Flammeovirgaceae bacterium]